MKCLKWLNLSVLTLVLLSTRSLFAQYNPEPALSLIDRVNESYAEYDVHGLSFGDGSIRVSVVTKDGNLQFESRYPVSKKDGRYFEWRHFGQPAYSMSRRLDPGAVRTLASMMFAAKDVVRTIKRGHLESDGKLVAEHGGRLMPASGAKFAIKPEDNFGCEWPFEDMSCTSNGNCCDTHDMCYELYGCDALSWLGLQSYLCSGCNELTVACVTLGTNNSGSAV